MEPKTPPRIFDARARRLRRDRAAARFEDAAFLHERAVEDVLDRLSSVNKSFGSVTVTGDAGLLSDDALLQKGAERIVRGDISERFAARRAVGRRAIFSEDALPFAPEAFDLSISILTLHGVDDLPGALAQIRRSLRPDGLFIGVLFGGETLGGIRRALIEAEAAASGGASPRVFPFADVRALGGLLQRAGFALPVADVDRVEIEYSSAVRLVADLRAIGETNALAARDRRPAGRAQAGALLSAMETALSRAPALFEIVTLTGWAPHESQQKPLAPGSAKSSLAAAVRGARKE